MDEKESSQSAGTVIEVRPKALYRVRLEDGQVMLAGLSHTLRHSLSRLIVGDRVLVKFSKNDPHRGQITRKAH